MKTYMMIKAIIMKQDESIISQIGADYREKIIYGH